MKRVRAALLIGLLGLQMQAVRAQMTAAQAKAEAKALGQAQAAASQALPDSETTASQVPGYTGVRVTPESVLFDTPDTLTAATASAARTNEGAIAVTQGSRLRPRIAPMDIDQTIARSKRINEDPATYAQGLSAEGAAGNCVPLPPSSGSSGMFEASCNIGYEVTSAVHSCAIPLIADVTGAPPSYSYYAVPYAYTGLGLPDQADFSPLVLSGQCQSQGAIVHACDAQVAYGAGGSDVAAYLRFCKKNVRINAEKFVCSLDVVDPQGIASYITNKAWYLSVVGTQQITTRRDETACGSLAADSQCTQTGEVCTSSDPVTRQVNGVAVTQPCWAWERSYLCNAFTPAKDCAGLEAMPGCLFDREECIDEVPSGPCKTRERIYKCPIPATSSDDKQFVCGGDAYCINGDCEPIVRESSTEFKDALVALHAIDQAGKEFDPVNLTLFKGAPDSCHKPVFGLGNCCGGNGFPLIGVCDPGEKALAMKIDQGLCHYVGTYCSASALGICHTKRKSYCCFDSKLTRILQEQGRPQLGKGFGAAKKPLCEGFAIDEFARLDLSVMDFTEIYGDFLESAKLPDEVQTAQDIQQKIADYYARARGQ